MVSRTAKQAGPLVRIVAVAVMVVAAAFLIVGPMGCGKVDDLTGSNNDNKDKPAPSSPSPASANGDAIPATSVNWSYANVTGWPVTAKLNSVSVTPNKPAPTICWNRTLSHRWPSSGKIDGNMWVIANIGGQWYGSVWEGIYTGSTSMCRKTEAGDPTKGGHASDAPFIQTSTSPINTWFPQPGEKVCWLVTSVARGPRPKPPANERTQIVCQPWP